MKQEELKIGDVIRVKEKRSDYEENNADVRYRVDEIYSHHVVCTKLPYDYRVSFNFAYLREKGIIDTLPEVQRTFARNNVDAGMHYTKSRKKKKS